MTDNADLDDLLEEQPDDDHLVRRLRNQLKESSKRAKEAEELRTKLSEFERRDAIRAAGLELNDRQVRALLASHDGELTAEDLRATAVDLGFAQDETEVPEEEQAAHERVAAAAKGGKPPQAGVVTPADAAGWSTEKWVRFAKQHPEHAETIRRGEPVSGVTF